MFCCSFRYKRKLEEMQEDEDIEPARKYSRLLEASELLNYICFRRFGEFLE